MYLNIAFDRYASTDTVMHYSRKRLNVFADAGFWFCPNLITYALKIFARSGILSSYGTDCNLHILPQLKRVCETFFTALISLDNVDIPFAN